jgi:hypothetical protein
MGFLTWNKHEIGVKQLLNTWIFSATHSAYAREPRDSGYVHSSMHIHSESSNNPEVETTKCCGSSLYIYTLVEKSNSAESHPNVPGWPIEYIPKIWADWSSSWPIIIACRDGKHWAYWAPLADLPCQSDGNVKLSSWNHLPHLASAPWQKQNCDPVGKLLLRTVEETQGKMIKRTDLAETRKLPMLPLHMGVSLNGGTPKSSILVSDFQLPLAIGVPPFMETPIWLYKPWTWCWPACQTRGDGALWIYVFCTYVTRWLVSTENNGTAMQWLIIIVPFHLP